MINKDSLIIAVSILIVLNVFLLALIFYKYDKSISDKQFMSFCMKQQISDKDCKIPYQYKRRNRG